MSRSYKKVNIVKSKGRNANYNKIVRQTNKIRLNMGLEPLNDYELINAYDICERKEILTDPVFLRK